MTDTSGYFVVSRDIWPAALYYTVVVPPDGVHVRVMVTRGIKRTPYQDPRVTLRLRSEVQTVETAAGVAQAVNYLLEGAPTRDTADLIVLGASALFNPHILLRSGFSQGARDRR